MQEKAVPEELLPLREEIDRIDDEILSLLAKRFTVTAQVGELKARHQLNSVDPVREQQKLERLKERALEQGLKGEFVTELFQRIFDEVVMNHRSYLK